MTLAVGGTLNSNQSINQSTVDCVKFTIGSEHGQATRTGFQEKYVTIVNEPHREKTNILNM